DLAKEYLIAKGKHISVHSGDRVRAGEPMMDGAANPHDILKVLGEKELARYLVDETQEVYRLQGVKINDKHIETIVRQMLRRVRVSDVGDIEVESPADEIQSMEDALAATHGEAATLQPPATGVRPETGAA